MHRVSIPAGSLGPQVQLYTSPWWFTSQLPTETAAGFPFVRCVRSGKGKATVRAASLHHEEAAQHTEWEEAHAHHDAARSEAVPQDAGLHKGTKN